MTTGAGQSVFEESIKYISYFQYVEYLIYFLRVCASNNVSLKNTLSNSKIVDN